MNVSLYCIQTITLNDSDLAVPLLDFLLWAVQPGRIDSAEFDEALDDLVRRQPEFRVFRDNYIKTRVAAA